MRPIRITRADYEHASQILIAGTGSHDQDVAAEDTCLVWEMGGMFTQEMRDIMAPWSPEAKVDGNSYLFHCNLIDGEGAHDVYPADGCTIDHEKLDPSDVLLMIPASDAVSPIQPTVHMAICQGLRNMASDMLSTEVYRPHGELPAASRGHINQLSEQCLAWERDLEECHA